MGKSYKFLSDLLTGQLITLAMSVCLSIHSIFDMVNKRAMYARLFKFHMWVAHGKSADSIFFFYAALELYVLSPFSKRIENKETMCYHDFGEKKFELGL